MVQYKMTCYYLEWRLDSGLGLTIMLEPIYVPEDITIEEFDAILYDRERELELCGFGAKNIGIYTDINQAIGKVTYTREQIDEAMSLYARS
jgi:hypothetical protein